MTTKVSGDDLEYVLGFFGQDATNRAPSTIYEITYQALLELRALRQSATARDERFAKLRRYARHTPACREQQTHHEEMAGTTAYNRCLCGLDAILAKGETK